MDNWQGRMGGWQNLMRRYGIPAPAMPQMPQLPTMPQLPAAAGRTLGGPRVSPTQAPATPFRRSNHPVTRNPMAANPQGANPQAAGFKNYGQMRSAEVHARNDARQAARQAPGPMSHERVFPVVNPPGRGRR